MKNEIPEYLATLVGQEFTAEARERVLAHIRAVEETAMAVARKARSEGAEQMREAAAKAHCMFCADGCHAVLVDGSWVHEGMRVQRPCWSDSLRSIQLPEPALASSAEAEALHVGKD